MQPWKIDPDIRKAKTLTPDFYRSQIVYEKLIESAFVSSWQFIGHEGLIPEAGDCYPFELLAGSIEEPLLLVHGQDGETRCMSNVCTHRGKILVEEPTKLRYISCGYHGRCFHLDGNFKSMPEFRETEDFPAASDHLPKLKLEKLGAFLFTAISPKYSFQQVFGPILERLSWFPFEALRFVPEVSTHYDIDTHWALYCDNYLEGFHVPFVHPGLAESLDYKNYSTETFDYCNLQLGVAEPDASAFELPEDSKDYGTDIHAYYWWIFPNLMLNVYTWGVSVNIVEPLGKDKTRVRFLTYLLPGEAAKGFSKEMLHQTEMEDEAVVKSVHKGLQSRLYQYGRFSPKREQCVHHFQRLLADCLT